MKFYVNQCIFSNYYIQKYQITTKYKYLSQIVFFIVTKHSLIKKYTYIETLFRKKNHFL